MILTVTANTAIDKRYVVEDMRIGEVNRVKSVQATAGGKGLNVSRAAHLAGEAVTATGFAGGHAGEFIDEHLRAEGIRADFVWCMGESRDCINIWDEKNHKQTELLEPGFTVSAQDMDRLAAKFEELIDDASVATISGSLPAGGTAALYQRLMEIGKAHGKKVLLDTSGQTLVDCVKARPFFIKPNIDEIRMLTGLPVEGLDEAIEAAGRLHERGVQNVVISLGGDGAVMSSEEGVFRALVPRIDAVNTVGCGDSMTGGFAVAFSRGCGMEEALRFASSVSTASAMCSETGFFRPEDQKKIYDQIRVERLA